MSTLRYYCSGEGSPHVKRRLEEVKARWGVTYEIVDLSRDGQHDWGRNREVYERDFKPRAKILRRRTSESVARLRSHSGHYYVSLPPTLAVTSDGLIEWWSNDEEKVLSALSAVLQDGPAAIERLLQ